MASQTIASPIGPLTLSASGGQLTRVTFVGRWPPTDAPAPIPADDHSVLDCRVRRLGSSGRPHSDEDDAPVLADAAEQLAEYFDGSRTDFDLPLGPEGDEFHRDVWHLIAEIPYGETVTYGSIATRLGGIRLSQAVGSATGSNPLPLVIPCHRVIGSDGTLTGFGGGLDRKRFLLALEESDEVKASRLF